MNKIKYFEKEISYIKDKNNKKDIEYCSRSIFGKMEHSVNNKSRKQKVNQNK